MIVQLLFMQLALASYNDETIGLAAKQSFFDSIEFASIQSNQIEFNYIRKDLCYTAGIPDDCVLEGPEIRFDFPLYKKPLYGFVRFADLKTTKLKTEAGDPYYVTLETEIGVGTRLKINKIISAIVEISYNTANDDELYGGSQKNYNAGPAAKARIEAQLTKNIALCVGYILDNSQNASAEKFHGFKDKKPRMTFGKTELCGKVKLTDKVFIIASIKKMTKTPSDSNGTKLSSKPFI